MVAPRYIITNRSQNPPFVRQELPLWLGLLVPLLAIVLRRPEYGPHSAFEPTVVVSSAGWSSRCLPTKGQLRWVWKPTSRIGATKLAGNPHPHYVGASIMGPSSVSCPTCHISRYKTPESPQWARVMVSSA